MRIAFMGTPEFAVASLAALVAAGHSVAAVYTQPPRPRGRGQVLKPSPVHLFAEGLGLPVRTPERLRDPQTLAELAALDLDACVVVAFGQILPRAALDAPRLGCFNLHASLLPRWRGAAPIQRAIMAGDLVTGVQVMRMSEGLDEGPILLSESTEIAWDETGGSLHDRLARLGADLVPRALAALERGLAVETPQAEEGATYAAKLTSAEARIDWTRPAPVVDRCIRALAPSPGAWFELPGADRPLRVKALMSRLSAAAGHPGEVLDDDLLVACGDGAVRLTRLQREGRAPQDAQAFLRGCPAPAGVMLG